MTVQARVAALVDALGQKPFCDGCLADLLGLDYRTQANQVTKNMGDSLIYWRRKGKCARCGERRTVISRRSPVRA